jgi:hypothetical protein
MTPALASVAVFALEQLLKEAPHIYAGIVAVFSKPDVTIADLQQLRSDIQAETYEQLVPATQLPPAPQIETPPATEPTTTALPPAPAATRSASINAPIKP